MALLLLTLKSLNRLIGQIGMKLRWRFAMEELENPDRVGDCCAAAFLVRLRHRSARVLKSLKLASIFFMLATRPTQLALHFLLDCALHLIVMFGSFVVITSLAVGLLAIFSALHYVEQLTRLARR